MNERNRERVDKAVGKICNAVEIAFLIVFLPLLALFVYIAFNTPVR